MLSERRGCAAGCEAINGSEGKRNADQANTPEITNSHHSNEESDCRHANLSLGKGTSQAKVVALYTIVMKQLMKRVTCRESRGNQQQQGQHPAERRFRHAVEAGKRSSRSHDNTCNQAHAPQLRKRDLRHDAYAKPSHRLWLMDTPEYPGVTLVAAWYEPGPTLVA